VQLLEEWCNVVVPTARENKSCSSVKYNYNYNNVPRGRFQRDQYNCFKTANIYTLMKIKLTYIIMQHTYMYNQHNTANSEK